LKRNLTAGETVGQVIALMREHAIAPSARLNVVFMGMGEPLLNFRAVMKAIRIMAEREGLAIPERRMTLSTAGIIPGIRALGREPVRPKLAVSLNATTDEQRSRLMPLNRKYPLSELMAACREYPLRPRERLTFEYVLLDGINDSPEDAERVARLIRGLRAKVNLIPYNSGAQLPYCPPPFDRVVAFQKLLTSRGVPAFVRISRGQDIRGACGQLMLEASS
jgi:23S rRNA (adenine2503-C2)-methyltransferase